MNSSPMSVLSIPYKNGFYNRIGSKAYIYTSTINPEFPPELVFKGEMKVEFTGDPGISLFISEVEGWENKVVVAEGSFKVSTGGIYTFDIPVDGTYELENIKSVTVRNGKVTVTFTTNR